MTREEADFIVSYIQTLEDHSNHQAVMRALERDGYPKTEIAAALKILGKVAGRDCGIL